MNKTTIAMVKPNWCGRVECDECLNYAGDKSVWCPQRKGVFNRAIEEQEEWDHDRMIEDLAHKSIAAAQEAVKAALANSRRLMPEYWAKCVAQRSKAASAGSFYDLTAEEINAALDDSLWCEMKHPSIMAGCTAYATLIPGGHYGLVDIATLPDDAVLTCEDRKGTGMVSLTIHLEKDQAPKTDETWLIVGEDNGQQVVFTFHPGEPVSPSVTKMDAVPGTMTKQQALALGFNKAKIV